MSQKVISTSNDLTTQNQHAKWKRLFKTQPWRGVVGGGGGVVKSLCSMQWRSQDFSEGEAIVTTQFEGRPGVFPPEMF